MRLVKKILEDVRRNGDSAVKRYTKKFDGISLENLEVGKNEIRNAYKKTGPETVKIFKKAMKSIRKFAEKQMKQYKSFGYTKNGVTLGQKIIPIEKVGVYVPGGNYPLPSTALMCIIPAKIVGAGEIVVCSPKIKPETIVAADLAGADRIFGVGGVQAIAAMAYGTETVPKVDKIVGPGNVYVAEAKREVYGVCGIDFIAGPTELLIIADKSSNPAFIAADMLAQAEHDVNAKIILLTDSARTIRDVEKELQRQMKDLGTKEIAGKSLRNKKVIKVSGIEEGVKIANDTAPEHIEVQVRNPEKYVDALKNYGSMFIGNHSPVAFGDYCSGTNHVLPTGSAARYTGGLSVRDFIKIQTYQYINRKGAKRLSKTASAMARIEGTEAHEKSIKIRGD